ncbi:MAG TPA: flagellar basal body protein [Burkholderiales bacterium]
MTSLTALGNDATSALVSLALDAAASKHLAIAQNIANANNEGYRPLRVEFDRQLALFRNELLDRGDDARATRLVDTLRSSTVATEEPQAAAKVQLDVEVAKMAENTVHYQALLAARGKMASLVRIAINGGR